MQEGGYKFVYGIIIVIIIAIIVIGYGVVRSLFTVAPSAEGEIPIEQIPAEEMRIVTAKHQYKNDTHTYAGEIVMPTPCDALAWTVATTSDRAMISFKTTSPTDPCAQVITSQRFKVSFRGSASTSVEATLNNSPVRFNVIEAGSDENLDDFEIYIKG